MSTSDSSNARSGEPSGGKATVSDRLANAQTRAAGLRRRAGMSLVHAQGLLPDTFEELHTAIEELRVAEEEMRAQNEEMAATRLRLEYEHHRYLDLFEFAPDGYLITTLDGKILEANRAASRLLGIALRFLRGRPLAASVHEDDLRDFHRRLTALTAEPSGSSLQEWTLRLRRRSAPPFDAALTVAPVKPLPGEPPTLRWMVRDITDRRQAEEERLVLVQEQAARAEAEAARRSIADILNTVTDAFVTLDREWRFTYLNDSAAQMCRAAGVDPQSLPGQVLWEQFPTALGTAFQTEALRAAETRRMTQFEEYSHGLGRWLHVRIFPSEEGVVAYAQDISARKEAEAVLQAAYEKERRIAGILQNILLRTVPPEAFPRLTLETFYEAASTEAQIGGDFFDVFTLGAGQVALAVGDVSGKGLAAAEMTAEVKYALRAILREVERPAPALVRLNEFVCEAQRQGDLGSNHLVVLSLTTMNPNTGEAVCASAGGEPPLLLRQNGALETLPVNGLLLGVQPGVTYSDCRACLEPGDTLLLATDGLTESRHADTAALLGFDGFCRLAAEARARPSLHGMGQAILDGARGWAGGALHDDACLLLVRRKEQEEQAL